MKGTGKKIAGWLHLWLGLASGLVVIVVALTGSILVFEVEIEEWTNRDFYFTSVPAQAQRLPVDSLLHNARQYNADIKITGLEVLPASPERTVLFRGKRGEDTWHLAVDPYTGKVIRARNHTTGFFNVVLELHRYLLAGDVGKAITGVSCMIFAFMVLTGLILWWPKRRKYLKQRLQIKWKATGKRLNWDLHAVGGFYVHLVLLLMALTGLVWSYKWYNNALFWVFDGKGPKKNEVPANTVIQPVAAGYYEKIYQDANQRLAYKGRLSIAIPAKDSLSITVSKENFEASVTNLVDFLYFEKGTGKLLKERLYKNESMGMKARRLVLPIHSGEIYGWPTKIIAFLSTLVAVSLPITGLRIWLGRKKKKHVAAGSVQPAHREPNLPELAVIE